MELGVPARRPGRIWPKAQWIDRDLSPKGLQKRGERKSLQTDRVILVPGPDAEIAVFRDIYELFVIHGAGKEISEALNGKGILGEDERLWIFADAMRI